MPPSEVPQWLLDNLNSLDSKVVKTNEQLGTVITLITDLRVKEAHLQARVDTVDRHEDVIDSLKKQELATLADLATIKVHVANCDSTLKELKAAVESSKLEGVQLNTKITIYIGAVSFVVAAIGSVAVALLTKYLGG
jgi:uncharacterized protein Yka (UPF0111/DUF47 family)